MFHVCYVTTYLFSVSTFNSRKRQRHPEGGNMCEMKDDFSMFEYIFKDILKEFWIVLS